VLTGAGVRYRSAGKSKRKFLLKNPARRNGTSC
jgi:hypothetical protein